MTLMVGNQEEDGEDEEELLMVMNYIRGENESIDLHIHNAHNQICLTILIDYIM